MVTKGIVDPFEMVDIHHNIAAGGVHGQRILCADKSVAVVQPGQHIGVRHRAVDIQLHRAFIHGYDVVEDHLAHIHAQHQKTQPVYQRIQPVFARQKCHQCEGAETDEPHQTARQCPLLSGAGPAVGAGLEIAPKLRDHQCVHQDMMDKQRDHIQTLRQPHP